MKTIGLRIDPLDTLFFRDGRPFDAASRAYGGLPLPQTMVGALRTALLSSDSSFQFSKFTRAMRTGPSLEVREALKAAGAKDWVLNASFRGPWLALRPKGLPDCLIPLLAVPATLARAGGESRQAPGRWVRAEPLDPHKAQKLPGWSDPMLWPLWRRGDSDAKHPGGFLTLKGMRDFLSGGVPGDHQWYEPDDLFGFDHRTGIGVDMNTFTAADRQLYGVRLLALRTDVAVKGEERRCADVCLYEELRLTEDRSVPFHDPIPLGGEGRYAKISVVDPIEWPSVATGNRSMWALATPAIFGGGNLDRPSDPQLRAAASGSPLAVSGWDIARNGPRPTRFAVPAGAVYFIEGNSPLPHESFCTDPEDIAQGWGHALQGVWKDE